MKTLLIIALLFAGNLFAQEVETRPQPKWLLLTYSEYFELNHDISISRGWELGQKTERTFSMQPQQAKVNIQYDEEGNEISHDVRFVMRATTKMQEDSLLTGFELHDNYTPLDSTEIVVVDSVETNVVNWTLNHSIKQGVDTENLRTYIASQGAENYPPIPVEGEWCEAKVYAYGSDKAKCIQPHTRTHRTIEQEPALWLVIETVGGYPEWVPPTGTQDAYQTGDIVTYNGELWISKIDANTTVPDGDEPYNRYWEVYNE